MYYIIAFLFNLFFFIALIQKGEKFIFIVPFFVVLSDAMSILYPLGAKGFHNVLTLLVIIFFVLKIIFKYKQVLTFNIWLPILCAYYFILFLMSSDKYASFLDIAPFTTGFFFLPIGFYLISTAEDLAKLNKTMLLVLGIFVLNFLFSNIFSLGDDPYGLGIHGGELTRESSFFVTIPIILIPLIRFRRYRPDWMKIYYLLSSLSFIALVLLLRRSPIIIVILGLLLFYLLQAFYAKKNTGKYFLLFGAILLSLLVFMEDARNYVSQTRNLNEESTFVEQVESESRTLEVMYTFQERMAFSDSRKSIFGNEIFNSSANTGEYAYGFFGPRRPIHTTIANIVHGTGLFGLSIFLFLVFKSAWKYRVIKRRSYNNEAAQDLIKAMLIVLFFIFVANLYTRALYNLAYSSILFIYAGGLLRQGANNISLE